MADPDGSGSGDLAAQQAQLDRTKMEQLSKELGMDVSALLGSGRSRKRVRTFAQEQSAQVESAAQRRRARPRKTSSKSGRKQAIAAAARRGAKRLRAGGADDGDSDSGAASDSSEEWRGRNARGGSGPARQSYRNLGREIQYCDDNSDSDEVANKRYERWKRQQKEVQGGIDQVLDSREEETADGERVTRYHIKWKGMSHIHNTWSLEEELVDVRGAKKLSNFQKSERERRAWEASASPEDVEMLNVSRELQRDVLRNHLVPERIIAVREAEYERRVYPFQNPARLEPDDMEGEVVTQYLVKWTDLPYEDATWENDSDIDGWQSKIDDFLRREEMMQVKGDSGAVRRKFKRFETQPKWMTGGTLRDYQIIGVNWLLQAWCNQTNGILADEMGLGKTIQCVSFLSYLMRERNIRGPFLCVVPLSTVPAWSRECAKWGAGMNTIVYVGNKKSRKMIRDYEFGTPKKVGFHTLITTYEFVNIDKGPLSAIDWKFIMVDEAHRLKDSRSLLYKSLMQFRSGGKLLVTGTPLQNSVRELWCLLHYLDPIKFGDLEAFEEKYSNVTTDKDGKKIHALHELLHGRLLRRVKKDVLKSLPAKNERILHVGLSAMQKKYSRWIVTRNFRDLNRGVKAQKATLSNIVMELKKCCNHPFLFKSAEQSVMNSDPKLGQVFELSNEDRLKEIIRNSGKMVLLDKLLVRLKETGHRVLIFSQMVRMLDILSEYLMYRKFQHQRLDGSMRSDLRQRAMDHFNSPSSKDFCFLLSTRAGGLGINLATADTVIIFDSDWNPQNDLQAQARCHRIGQKKTVNIYRLVTKNSVEETILERAKKKMVLDHLVIQQMDTSGRTNVNRGKAPTAFSKDDLDKVLKFAGEDLFKDEEGGEKRERQVEDMDIDEILERAEKSHQDAQEKEMSAADELRSSYRVASFSAIFEEDDGEEEDDANKGKDGEKARDEKDPNFWKNVVPENAIPEDQLHDDDYVPLYLPPRNRNVVRSYAYNDLLQDQMGEEEEEEESDEEDPEGLTSYSSFSKKDSRQLYNELLRQGDIGKALDVLKTSLWRKKAAILDMEAATEHAQKIIDSCAKAVRDDEEEAAEDKAGDEEDGAEEKKRRKTRRVVNVDFMGNLFRASTLIERIEEFRVLHEEIALYLKKHADVLNFRVTFNVRNWDLSRVNREWGRVNDSRLLVGVSRYGLCWEPIVNDAELQLGALLAVDEPVGAENSNLNGANSVDGPAAVTVMPDETAAAPKPEAAVESPTTSSLKPEAAKEDAERMDVEEPNVAQTPAPESPAPAPAADAPSAAKPASFEMVVKGPQLMGRAVTLMRKLVQYKTKMKEKKRLAEEKRLAAEEKKREAEEKRRLKREAKAAERNAKKEAEKREKAAKRERERKEREAKKALAKAEKAKAREKKRAREGSTKGSTKGKPKKKKARTEKAGTDAPRDWSKITFDRNLLQVCKKILDELAKAELKALKKLHKAGFVPKSELLATVKRLGTIVASAIAESSHAAKDADARESLEFHLWYYAGLYCKKKPATMRKILAVARSKK